MVRTMSGILPTGDLHLGNYLDALVNWVEQQSRFDAFFCKGPTSARATALRDQSVRSDEILAAGADKARAAAEATMQLVRARIGLRSAT